MFLFVSNVLKGNKHLELPSGSYYPSKQAVLMGSYLNTVGSAGTAYSQAL